MDFLIHLGLSILPSKEQVCTWPGAYTDHSRYFCSTAPGIQELLKEFLTLLQLGLGTEFRSEKIPRNRLGMVIPRKKVLIPRHSEFRGRVNSEARNGMERNGIPQKY